jgi:hypothetical protein
LLWRIVLKSVKSARIAWFATWQPDDDASVTVRIAPAVMVSVVGMVAVLEALAEVLLEAAELVVTGNILF